MLALRWRTVTAIDHPLLILLRINNWCLNIYILWFIITEYQLKAIWPIVFCLIRGMSSINYYLLKRILDITCGNVLITLLCLSQIIIWSGRIFCTECYLWIPSLLGVCLPTGVCMYISTYCIVYTLFADLFTKLISIFVLIAYPCCCHYLHLSDFY